jgi:hypothetical protein
MKLNMIIKTNLKCYHISMYFQLKKKKHKKYLDYLNGYVSQILEHIYGGSSSKFICICGISFYIYRLSKIGSKIVSMEKYRKNQYIYI